MSVRDQLAIVAISPDSESPAASQRWPERVQVESVDAGVAGAPAQGLVEAVVPEAGAALPQPQPRTVGGRVLGTCGEIAADCGDRRRPDRDGAQASALAAAHRDPVEVEVEVAEVEGHDLASPDAGLEHEPDQGLVAAVVQRLVGPVDRAGAGGDEGTQLALGEREHDRTPLRRPLDAEERVAGHLAGGSSQAQNPLTDCLRASTVPGALPESSRWAIQVCTEVRSIGAVRAAVHQSR